MSRLASVAVLAMACGGTPVAAEKPRAPRAEEPRAQDVRAGLDDDAWGVAAAPGASVRLLLPQRERWTTSTRRGWLVASHPGSLTTVMGSGWRAEGVVSPGACEREVRRRRSPLDALVEAEPFSMERVDGPEGYATEVRLSARSLAGGGVEGVVLAFGASVRRCIAFGAVTRATGAGAERAVSARLGVLAPRAILGLHVPRIEDRVPRAR